MSTFDVIHPNRFVLKTIPKSLEEKELEEESGGKEGKRKKSPDVDFLPVSGSCQTRRVPEWCRNIVAGPELRCV